MPAGDRVMDEQSPARALRERAANSDDRKLFAAAYGLAGYAGLPAAGTIELAQRIVELIKASPFYSVADGY